MAKYRPVDLRLWNDRKFLSLSQDGRMLWLFLLTCPFTLPIPGVVVSGHGAIADHLEWSRERLAQRFTELFDKGLAVKLEGRVIWLPNALRYQPPANPNVLRGWAKIWDDIPEGSLKHDIWQALKIACRRWRGLFVQLLSEPVANGLLLGSGERFAEPLLLTDHGQDQDQDQDQERESEPPLSPEPQRSDPDPKTIARPDHVPRRPDAQIKINHDAWAYAAAEHARLRADGIGTDALNWPVMPCGGAANDVVERTRELRARGLSDEDVAAVHRRRVDVAAAEARRDQHLRWFKPSRLWQRESFERGTEVTPAEISVRHGARATEAAEIRIKRDDDDNSRITPRFAGGKT